MARLSSRLHPAIKDVCPPSPTRWRAATNRRLQASSALTCPLVGGERGHAGKPAEATVVQDNCQHSHSNHVNAITRACALHTQKLLLSACSGCQLNVYVVLSCPAAGMPGSSFGDLNDRRITKMGQSISGNMLANANIALGDKVNVTGFVVQGTSQVIKPGGAPVTLNDLRTGKAMGKLSINFDGTYDFEPAPGFTGAAPAVSLYLQNSDKQTTVSALALEVLPSERGHLLVSK